MRNRAIIEAGIHAILKIRQAIRGRNLGNQRIASL